MDFPWDTNESNPIMIESISPFGSLDQREQVAHVEVQRLALLVTVVARAAYQVELEALSAVPVFPACFANSLHPVCFHLILVEVGRVWLPAEKRGNGETSFKSFTDDANG